MAKTKRHQQQKHKQQKQLLVIYLTICLTVVSLLTNVDSACASSIPLDGSGNMLQQQQHQHVIDNNEKELNYIMDSAKQNSINEQDEDKKTNFDLLDFGQSGKPVNMVKRAPSGFVGMRGKKLFEEDGNSLESNDENDVNFNLLWNQLQNSGETINWDDYAKPNVRRFKKAPNAFYGVRGKKFVTMNGLNANTNDNSHWQDFLQKLEEERVRDALLQDFVERLAGTKSDLTNDLTKRAPTGFTGLRGKRPFSNEFDSEMESLSKRGLGNNAFIGVRGKKDVSHQTFKRSPAGPERYFFGFWKKSFPGRNGKRQRFVDFNNKFVAVRGKKSSYDDMTALNAISNSGIQSDTVSLSPYDKRAPKGFLGMRGKRPLATDDI